MIISISSVPFGRNEGHGHHPKKRDENQTETHNATTSEMSRFRANSFGHVLPA